MDVIQTFCKVTMGKGVLERFTIEYRKISSNYFGFTTVWDWLRSLICIWSYNGTQFKSALTTVFVDTPLWKTKDPRKRFQNFRQSYVLLTVRIEIHQSQPLAWPFNLLYVMLAGCDWWISIRHVDNTEDWRKFWKRFRECFVFQSRVSTKTVVT